VALTGFQPIHPRKLYAKLLGMASADERAQATLDFLCGCTASARGHLFLVRSQGLRPAANSGQGPPQQDLVSEVVRTWGQELVSEPDASRTRTVDLPTRTRAETPVQDQLWTSSSGVTYVRHVLGTYHGMRWIPVGIAMLEAGAKFIALRHAYVEVVCNAFIAAGEVPGQRLDSR
jgi:hypothetical protein